MTGGRNPANPSDDNVDRTATLKTKPGPKSLASSEVKLILRGIAESPDAFSPLKSAVGAMLFMLDNCGVRHPLCTTWFEKLTSFLDRGGMSSTD